MNRFLYVYLLGCLIVPLFFSCEKEVEWLEDDITEPIIRVDTIVKIDTLIKKDTIFLNPEEIKRENIDYPSSKIWYHAANYLATLPSISEKFEGLEFDVNYDPVSQKIYVCHDLQDTIYQKVTIEEWFATLPDPTRNWYWIDFKNLWFYQESICQEIEQIALSYGIKDRIWIESNMVSSLEVVQQYGIKTILTIDNLNAQPYGEYVWQYFVYGKIASLKPSAIGCDYTMCSLLVQYFGEQEIFIWHTGVAYTEANVEQTRDFCRIPSVKVVLVDYGEPINY